MPVVLLCHCDGTNGSTTFTDVSPSAHTLTNTSVFVSTSVPKFGTGSADFTNVVSSRLDTGTSADFRPGAGQFTIEAWVYFLGTPILCAIVSQWDSGSNNGWWLGMNSTVLTFFYSTTGSDAPTLTFSYNPPLNTWVHIAVDRDAANVLRLYINGVVVNSATVSSTFFASTRNCLVGNDFVLNRAFPGRLDEIRVTIGQAQYGGAFTPPTGPFGGGGGTAPTLDQFLTSTTSGGTATTISVTSAANRVVLVCTTIGASPLSVAPALSISGAGLTWTALPPISGFGSGGFYCTVQVWWAFTSGAITAQTVTITSSTAIDDAATVYATYAGANTVAPLDPNASSKLSVFSAGPSLPLQGSVSTTLANDVTVFVGGTNGGAGPNTPTVGSTPVANASNGGGTRFAYCFVNQLSFSSPQTNTTVGFGTAPAPTGLVAVTLTADSAVVAGTAQARALVLA